MYSVFRYLWLVFCFAQFHGSTTKFCGKLCIIMTKNYLKSSNYFCYTPYIVEAVMLYQLIYSEKNNDFDIHDPLYYMTLYSYLTSSYQMQHYWKILVFITLKIILLLFNKISFYKAHFRCTKVSLRKDYFQWKSL